ncbi:MAG: NADH-quinone oxidoreductase subunit C [Pseudomonadota bacterium]|nr:NADH-quinone oxidoreductase subunit C [Pseudomonadota bacterium]|tara:strand:- start:1491 stop:2114 length:624 start_codon:yes stop_codon:yes gene_type:complete
MAEETDRLYAHLSSHIEEANSLQIADDEIVISSATTSLLRLIQFLKEDQNCKFNILIDICGVDYPEKDKRFEIVYHFLSLSVNRRIRVKLMTDEETKVPSIVDLFPSAGWYEREVYDLFGVIFSGNTDLRRLLTDYGFKGHPLRKDFPLTGYVEVRYDEEQKRVIYEPVKLTQEFRNFDFVSPWEGMNRILPGDERTEELAKEDKND